MNFAAIQVGAYINFQLPDLLTKAKAIDVIGLAQYIREEAAHRDWVLLYAEWSLKKEKHERDTKHLKVFTEEKPIEPSCDFYSANNYNREHYMMGVFKSATKFYSYGEKIQGELFMSQAEYNQFLYWENSDYKLELEKLAEE